MISSIALKRKIASFWPANKNNTKFILLYHSVGTSSWALSEKQFVQQIDYLVNEFQIVSLSEFMQNEVKDRTRITLTFDDGYQSLYEKVLPILLDYKIQATVYLTTGWINDGEVGRISDANLGHYPGERFLTWKEVKLLHANGWQIGAHGVNHYNLTQIEDEAAKTELTLSKQAIEEKLKIPCLYFAYPWGRYTKNTKMIAEQAGYRFSVSARHGEVNKHSDLQALPRINIASHYSFKDFSAILQGKWNYLKLYQTLKGL